MRAEYPCNTPCRAMPCHAMLRGRRAPLVVRSVPSETGVLCGVYVCVCACVRVCVRVCVCVCV